MAFMARDLLGAEAREPPASFVLGTFSRIRLAVYMQVPIVPTPILAKGHHRVRPSGCESGLIG